MRPLYLSLCVIFLTLANVIITSKAAGIVVPFVTNYSPLWGGDHVIVLDRGTRVQIRIDPYSGGGFISKEAFGSGRFRMNMKMPKNSKGMATTFYLTSVDPNGRGGGHHDEHDFELLGSNAPPYTLNTNVFAQDSGNSYREQQFHLWFDPTADFHQYEILWNPKQIVFFVDRVPIRVYKNNKNIGAKYPILPMYVRASLWNDTQWLGPVDWNKGPFLADYRGFEIRGCPFDRSNPTKCYSQSYAWNQPSNWELNVAQKRAYENARKRYLTYDYCQSRYGMNFPECRFA